MSLYALINVKLKKSPQFFNLSNSNILLVINKKTTNAAEQY